MLLLCHLSLRMRRKMEKIRHDDIVKRKENFSSLSFHHFIFILLHFFFVLIPHESSIAYKRFCVCFGCARSFLLCLLIYSVDDDNKKREIVVSSSIRCVKGYVLCASLAYLLTLERKIEFHENYCSTSSAFVYAMI